MDWSHAFSVARWRARFRTEDAVASDARAAGRAPDASVDEVGVPGEAVGFDGPIASPTGNGQGSGTPGSPGWAGWGTGGGHHGGGT
jgi:hypothetical protein